MNKYKLPNNRQDKIEVLKALMKGQITVDDLKEESIEVWRVDKTDSQFMVCTKPALRISNEDYETRVQATKNTTFIKVLYVNKQIDN